jgi:hypothetical protein
MLTIGSIVWGVRDVPRAIQFWSAALRYRPLREPSSTGRSWSRKMARAPSWRFRSSHLTRRAINVTISIYMPLIKAPRLNGFWPLVRSAWIGGIPKVPTTSSWRIQTAIGSAWCKNRAPTAFADRSLAFRQAFPPRRADDPATATLPVAVGPTFSLDLATLRQEPGRLT